MNAKEIIESGKLELYVAGVLCGKERDQVAAMVNTDPMLKREVQKIEEAMLATLNEGKYEPRAAVKDKVMAGIRSETNNPVRKLTPSAVTEGTGKVVPMNRINTWLAAASVFLLFGLGFAIYFMNEELGKQENEIASLNEKYNSQVAANDSTATVFSKFSEQLALINHQNTKKIILSGVANTPDAKAIVYWNTQSGRIIINPSALPAPPSDKQYQLWALLDGKPIDAGVFDITKDSINLHEVKNIGNAQAFAVTLEQKGGVASPTLTAMYVMGAI